MKAIILSGSESSRLRPITCTIPCSMLPVMGRPLIEHTVRNLHSHGIDSITFMTDYLSDSVKKHFKALPHHKIKVCSLQNMENIFDDDTLIMADSIFTDIDVEKLSAVFLEKQCCVMVTRPDSSDCFFGSVLSDSCGNITKYDRCPEFTHNVGLSFSGILLIPKGTNTKPFSDMSSLAQNLFNDGKKVLSYSPACYIKNISDYESYHKCNRDFMDKKISLPFPCDEKAPGVWIDENATVMQGCVLVPPVYIGSGSIISKGAGIEAYTQIMDNVSVDCFANIKRSIVMSGSHIDEGASLRGAIICNNCSIGYESAIYEGSVIASGSSIGKHSTVRSGIHIWPEKHVDDESIVSENIVWSESGRQSMFFDGSAYGIINRDITPEFSSTLSASVCTLLGKKIAVSSGSGGIGTMIKNALIAGIQSAGGIAYDLGEQPLPITRSAVRFYGLNGAVALSCRKEDGNIYGSLDIVNSSGANVENSVLAEIRYLVENCSYNREDPKKILDGEFLFEYKLYYLKQLINSTSKKQLKKKVLICCPVTWAKELLESASRDLDCSFIFTSTYQREHFLVEFEDSDYDFGVICDYKCETLILITGHGQILSEFDYMALTSLIIMKSFPNAALYLPESAPESINIMAASYNATVNRTPLSPPYLMNELSKQDKKMFLHQFIYRFDAVGTIILLIDFLYNHNTSIEQLAGEIPSIYMESTCISCKEQNQKDLMQKFCIKHGLDSEANNDFVKINFKNGWVIVAPARSESAIKVISHGHSKEYAREIADIFTDDLSS